MQKIESLKGIFINFIALVLFTARRRNCGKVMFSQGSSSAILAGGGGW